MTGTLLRAGDQIRVTSQLTDASTGTLVWSDSTQAAIGDLFQLQDELARRILESLKLPLTNQDRRARQHDVPASAKAYDYYLRGNQLSHDSKQWPVAGDLYLRAVEEDPRYAPAWARLGRIHHVIAKYLPTGAADGLDLAEQAFQRHSSSIRIFRSRTSCTPGSKWRGRLRQFPDVCARSVAGAAPQETGVHQTAARS